MQYLPAEKHSSLLAELKTHAEEYKQYITSNIHDKAKEFKLKEKLNSIKEKYGILDYKSYKENKEHKHEAKLDDHHVDRKGRSYEEIPNKKVYGKGDPKYKRVIYFNDTDEREKRAVIDNSSTAQIEPTPKEQLLQNTYKTEKLNHMWQKLKNTNLTEPQIVQIKEQFDLQQHRIEHYNTLVYSFYDAGNGS